MTNTLTPQPAPRVVMYGLGSMGSLIARMILDRGGEIVGAVVRSSEKAGRDVGEFLDPARTLGVTLTTDPDEALAAKPDLVIVTVASYMEDVYDPIRRSLEAGANVLSLSEELLYSWTTEPERTRELDELARRMGVTLTCSGHQDGYWVSLIAAFMGSAHTISTIGGQATWNVDDFGPELARDQQVGSSVAEFDAWLSEVERPPTFGRTTLEALAAMSGLTVTETSTSTRAELTADGLHCTALGVDVPAGHVIGFTDIDTIRTAEGVELQLEMCGKVYQEGESDSNTWTIHGEPTVTLRNEDLPTHLTTCATLVNRIPQVLAADPGYATLDALPPLRFQTTLR